MLLPKIMLRVLLGGAELILVQPVDFSPPLGPAGISTCFRPLGYGSFSIPKNIITTNIKKNNNKVNEKSPVKAPDTTFILVGGEVNGARVLYESSMGDARNLVKFTSV
ncbi:hypothetical protein AB990_07065 [Alkalihalobacillus pseudalcaliphilus]|nr:hypothetical protein AB990_07065 [Alkalihalobacillus pseudalcaliphilus]